MAIYKPNGFYPYLQEVDMEDVNGNIFSCQINTDGGMCSGGRIKIYLNNDDTVLYENLYQFYDGDRKVPIPNGQMGAFEIKPYKLENSILNITDDTNQGFVNNGNIVANMDFVSLTPNLSYNSRKDLCPYNILNLNLDKKLYNVIIHFYKQTDTVSFDEKFCIPIEKIDYVKNENFNVTISNLDCSNMNGLITETVTYEDLVNNMECYVSLRNDYGYMWEIELFEHYFEDNYDTSTFVTDGYVTGSTNSVLWYDKSNQTNIVKNNDYLIKKDNYIDIEADSGNSDLFKDELIAGYTDTGKLNYKPTEIKEWTVDMQNIVEKYNIPYSPDGKSVRFTSLEELNKTENFDNIDFSYGITEGSYHTNKYKGFLAIDPHLPWKYDSTQNIDNFLIDIQHNNITYKGKNIFNPNTPCYKITNNHDSAKKKEFDDYNLGNLFIEYGCFVLPNLKNQIIVTDNFGKDIPFCTTESIEKEIQKYCGPIGENGKRPGIQHVKGGEYGDSHMFYNFEDVEFVDGVPHPKVGKNPRKEMELKIDNVTYRAKVLKPNMLNFSNIYAPQIWDKIKYTSQYDENLDLQSYSNESICIGKGFTKPTVASFVGHDGAYNWMLFNDYTFEHSFMLSMIFWKFCVVNDSSKEFRLYYNPKTGSVKYPFSIEIYKGTSSEYSLNYWAYSTIKTLSFFLKVDTYSDIDNSLKWDGASSSIQTDFSAKYFIYDNITKDSQLLREVTKNKGNIFTYKQENMDNSFLKIPYIRVDYKSAYRDLRDITFKVINKNNIDKTFILDTNSIDFNKTKILDNLYLDVTDNTNDVTPDELAECIENPLKINKYNINDKSISFQDGIAGDILKKYLLGEDDVEIRDLWYQVKYKDRQQITWVTDLLGHDENYKKIELKESIKINLKNECPIGIYKSDNKMTYNTFYGIQDSDLNVDNLYVRFPKYDGMDYTDKYLNEPSYYTSYNDTGFLPYPRVDDYYYKKEGDKYVPDISCGSLDAKSVKGAFYQADNIYYFEERASSKDYYTKVPWTTDTFQPLKYYGQNVLKSQMDENDIKLFKVINYDYETGEIVIAGGLKFDITSSMTYELWQANAIEGSSNKYDITEVIQSYTRIYPKSDDYDAKAYCGNGNKPLIAESIKITNSTNSNVFIQPNINFYTNEYNPAIIDFIHKSEKRNIVYSYDKECDWRYKDISINKLDDSQWLLNFKNPLSFAPIPGEIYHLYIDTAKSIPANFFYAKATPKIDIKYENYSLIRDSLKDNNYLYNLNENKKTYPSVSAEKTEDGAGIVKYLDTYFCATYDNCSTPIKRYRYKLYDENVQLILDSEYIYDNLLGFRVNGLINGKYYLLELECENQDNKVDIIKQMIYVDYVKQDNIGQYDENHSDDPVYNKQGFILDCKNNTDLNCVEITLFDVQKIIVQQQKRSWFTYGLLSDKSMNMVYFKDCIGGLYKKQKFSNQLEFVRNIIWSQDFISYTDERGAEKHKYVLKDYNVYNNTNYEYILIMDNEGEPDLQDNTKRMYRFTSENIYTCFDGWSMIDIVETDDNTYKTVGDIWKFKYNLESNDMTMNNSITTYDTLSRYAQVSHGKKQYMTGGLSCLLGDIGVYYSIENNSIKKHDGYHEKYKDGTESRNYNNITKFLKWKEFINNDNLKLLKDIKGNKWIVKATENPTVKNNDSSQEQIYTLSFQWIEVADSNTITVAE